MKLINKKWKVIMPTKGYTMFVIVPVGWKCSCDKDDYQYKKIGCYCHVGNLDAVDIIWNKREVFEHIVKLHNESLDK